ncbi:MAG: MFS transporter [Gemmatimonadaceae bacterium]|nr:MFS transporter [Gemmatimonadaceae bacterium]
MTDWLASPVVQGVGAALAAGVVWLLWREVRTIPAKLHVLMATAFLDMVGTLMVLPLLPFYAQKLGASGTAVGLLVSSFAAAQLLSAPLWGRFSDKYGRRPTLMVALGASAVAYVVFGYATSLWLLFASRLVQGAGGGTVGVIQAYVADATEPQERTKALGWLSAATNLGVALGPVLGSWAATLGQTGIPVAGTTWQIGPAAPGLFAAALCVLNLLFARKYLPESKAATPAGQQRRSSRAAVLRVVTHPGEIAPRLIWIYAVAMGAFQGVTAMLALYLNAQFAVTERSIGFVFMYVGLISVVARALILGKLVDALGEARLSRLGTVMLASGVLGMALAPNLAVLLVATALMPLGTAFTFPCVSAMLSKVIPTNERGMLLGVQQTFGGVARVAFPALAGVLFEFGPTWPFIASAALVALTLPMTAGIGRAVAAAQAAPAAPAAPPAA